MKKPYIFPLLLGSLVLTGCANGQIDAMQMRLNQQEQQIRLLNSQLSGVQPAQADTWAQVTLQNIGVDVAETGEQL